MKHFNAPLKRRNQPLCRQSYDGRHRMFYPEERDAPIQDIIAMRLEIMDLYDVL